MYMQTPRSRVYASRIRRSLWSRWDCLQEKKQKNTHIHTCMQMPEKETNTHTYTLTRSWVCVAEIDEVSNFTFLHINIGWMHFCICTCIWHIHIIYLTYSCIAAYMHILNGSLIFLHAYIYWNTHTHTCKYADAEITSVCHGVDDVSDLVAIAYNTTVYRHIYVCMHMYTNICTCLRTYINISVYICIETFVCRWKMRYIWIWMYVHT